MTAVLIGTAVVAHIEPAEGEARAFNRWYELDHFYAAAMAGPGMYAGARWVATRACKDVRVGDGLFGDPARGSYLATYWVLPTMQAEWDAWVARQMEALVAEGNRMFAGREHLHTAVYQHAFDIEVTGGPPAIAALDHGFAGVIEIAVRGDGIQDVREWMHEQLASRRPVSVGLVPERTVLSSTEPGEHAIAFLFCEDDPLATFTDEIAPALGELDGVGFASPYLATIPGTDTYTDRL